MRLSVLRRQRWELEKLSSTRTLQPKTQAAEPAGHPQRSPAVRPLWRNWSLSDNSRPGPCCKCRRNRPHLLPRRCCSRRRPTEPSGPRSQTVPADTLWHRWAPGGWLQACTWGSRSPGGLGRGEPGWSKSTQDTPVYSPGHGGRQKET